MQSWYESEKGVAFGGTTRERAFSFRGTDYLLSQARRSLFLTAFGAEET